MYLLLIFLLLVKTTEFWMLWIPAKLEIAISTINESCWKMSSFSNRNII